MCHYKSNCFLSTHFIYVIYYILFFDNDHFIIKILIYLRLNIYY